MKTLITLAILSTTTLAGESRNVMPVKNNLGLQAVSQGVVLETVTNESGDITFVYENGYCVNFANTIKLICNLGE